MDLYSVPTLRFHCKYYEVCLLLSLGKTPFSCCTHPHLLLQNECKQDSSQHAQSHMNKSCKLKCAVHFVISTSVVVSDDV